MKSRLRIASLVTVFGTAVTGLVLWRGQRLDEPVVSLCAWLCEEVLTPDLDGIDILVPHHSLASNSLGSRVASAMECALLAELLGRTSSTRTMAVFGHTFGSGALGSPRPDDAALHWSAVRGVP